MRAPRSSARSTSIRATRPRTRSSASCCARTASSRRPKRRIAARSRRIPITRSRTTTSACCSTSTCGARPRRSSTTRLYQASLAEPNETVGRWIIDLRRRVGNGRRRARRAGGRPMRIVIAVALTLVAASAAAQQHGVAARAARRTSTISSRPSTSASRVSPSRSGLQRPRRRRRPLRRLRRIRLRLLPPPLPRLRRKPRIGPRRASWTLSIWEPRQLPAMRNCLRCSISCRGRSRTWATWSGAP